MSRSKRAEEWAKETEGTISVNGGPEMPLSAVRAALSVVGGAKPKRTAGQAEIEDITGPGENGEEIRKQGGIAADRLRSIIERVERLEEERKALGSDIKDMYSEAKGQGFDVKVIRQIIVIRRQEPSEVAEFESLLDVYRRALGM